MVDLGGECDLRGLEGVVCRGAGQMMGKNGISAKGSPDCPLRRHTKHHVAMVEIADEQDEPVGKES